jgi:1-acyl-sn-glycerol-3-phosphate acyltransferase
MIYHMLRWISGIAINWFYRDIRITNCEAIPDGGPLLIAVNHQNALVDSLITGWVVPRRVTMTAKATLMGNPFVALLFRVVGVVPLRRASDEVTRTDANGLDRSRNNEAFSDILDVLETGGAVLIFPEGKSHNETRLEPLKTGLARLAFSARDNRGIRGVRILPVGLVFEDKAAPGSVVGVNIGDSIEMDSWSGCDAGELTAEIAERLRTIADHRRILEREAFPPATHQRPITSFFIRAAAAWGRHTHELPIRLARRLAVRRSLDADQPAMRTIVLGTGLVLLTYVASFAIVEAVTQSIWFSALWVTSLAFGAYWAAFEDRPRSR